MAGKLTQVLHTRKLTSVGSEQVHVLRDYGSQLEDHALNEGSCVECNFSLKERIGIIEILGNKRWIKFIEFVNVI